MRNGGIILFDTRDEGTGEGYSPGARAALRRVTRDLAVPPLAPVPEDHVLKRAFYLLSDLPGRFAGGTVWVARDGDRANDSVSPVIIGGHDWASAWAMDARGQNPFAVVPGGARQRTTGCDPGVARAASGDAGCSHRSEPCEQHRQSLAAPAGGANPAAGMDEKDASRRCCALGQRSVGARGTCAGVNATRSGAARPEK